MKTRTAMLCAVAAFACAAELSGQKPDGSMPPMSEREAAAALMDNRINTPERDRALRLATELGPRASADLKAAVIDAAWAELRGEVPRPEGDEAIFDYVWALCRLRDARAIPPMLEAISMGPMVSNALADLGAAAFPAVFAAVKDPKFDDDVPGGLLALRFMVEDGSLNGHQLEQVREVGRERLSGMQGVRTVMAAAWLAIALEDPQLRRIVERIATDRAAAEALVAPPLGPDHW